MIFVYHWPRCNRMFEILRRSSGPMNALNRMPIFIYIFFTLIFQWDRASVGQDLLIHEVSRLHTTHHSRWDCSGRVISSTQRPLTTHNTTDILASGGIRTHNFSRRVASDPRLRTNARPLGSAVSERFTLLNADGLVATVQQFDTSGDVTWFLDSAFV
jgi:hypothetical protein